VFFGYAIHKGGLIMAHGGSHDEEDKVLAFGHGDYAGWTITRVSVIGNQSFKGVKASDVVELAWRPTSVPPTPAGMVTDMWDNRTVIVKEATSEDVLLVSQLQSFPSPVKVAYTVKRHVKNDPPTAEEIEVAVSKAQADGAILYRAEKPIDKDLHRVKEGQLFCFRTNKPAEGIEYGFEGKKGLVSRMWARVFGGG